MRLHTFSWRPVAWLCAVMGTMLVLTTSEWILVWAGLVLNLVAVLGLMSRERLAPAHEGTMKYFILQSSAALGFLAMTFINPFMPLSASSTLILAMITLKLGAFPLHFWVPQVFPKLAWPMFLLLSTWQKIAPLALLIGSINMINPTMVTALALMTMLVGAVGAWYSQSWKTFMAYSSINQSGWFLLLTLVSLPMLTVYFMAYALQMTVLILTLHFCRLADTALIATKSNVTASGAVLLATTLISMSGMPPFIGFGLKLVALNHLASFPLVIPTTILLLVPSLMMTCLYLTISTMLLAPKKLDKRSLKIKALMMIPLSLIMPLMIIPAIGLAGG